MSYRTIVFVKFIFLLKLMPDGQTRFKCNFKSVSKFQRVTTILYLMTLPVEDGIDSLTYLFDGTCNLLGDPDQYLFLPE